MVNSTLAEKMISPGLKARLLPWMKQVIKNHQKVNNWLNTHGSPLHVVELAQFKNNINLLKAPLAINQLKGQLYFARKANKLPWFVKEAARLGIGVDTASINEVMETLDLGVPAENIIITAVGKTRTLVEKAIEKGCLLIIDNLDELELIEATARTTKKEARIGLRFSGFKTENRTVFSRFGFPIEDARELAIKTDKCEFLKLENFHAHIDKYDPVERAYAAFEMLTIIDSLKENGINISSIDLGGGILINYLEEESDWLDYLESLKNGVLGTSPSFNYMNEGLGFYKEDGQLKGEMDLYPHWNSLAKDRFINAVLNAQKNGRILHKELHKRDIALSFEPGRALLDGCGITLARVAFRKRDTRGELLIGLSMNRMHLRPFRAEFCVDPLLVTDKKPEPLQDGAFLVGCLCSESDLIYKRRLKLDSMPLIGDAILFPNTAGYLAHHMEIGTHGDSIPTNILVNADDLSLVDTYN